MDLILKDGDEEILVEPNVSTESLSHTDDFLSTMNSVMEMVEQREWANSVRAAQKRFLKVSE